MTNCSLLEAAKMVKLAPHSMAEKQSLRSEGELLDEVVRKLEAQREVKEISGWESGFPNLSRALDGILPGLYLLVGPPASGKTSFAKQLLDQVAMLNAAPGIFLSFTENSDELRIRTLSRLSGLEKREIRRGSAYLLHWYGVPKAQHTDSLPPSWEKLKKSADDARVWLDRIYLVECGQAGWPQLEDQIRELKTIKGADRVMAVVDDCQRLGNGQHKLIDRVATVAEQLQRAAVKLEIPILGVWPDLLEDRNSLPQIWSERVPSADVILVMEIDAERNKKLDEPHRAVALHIVKNRGGEKGQVGLDFYPAFSKFVEIT
jgi:replicative DNA helicase